MNQFDVVVIGGGHAGIEATMAAAKRNVRVALITEHKHSIGHMPCNPSVGGSAKGIVVREIAALGGVMNHLADQSLLQLKMLNQSKGPAVWSLRAQVDIHIYAKRAQEMLEAQHNVTILEKRATNIIIMDDQVCGVKLQTNETISCQAVILTAGTYMRSLILQGHEQRVSGPNGFATSSGLSDQLQTLGFELFRLKTGTPARVKGSSIDFSKMECQPGDQRPFTFSFAPNNQRSIIKELPCYLTYAAKETIAIIEANLTKSAMYSGKVEGVGPRYCPSIEDKVVRFADKQRHQVFVEPVCASDDTMYIQGMSTSMPQDVQLEMLRAMKGMEACEVLEYGYAIEYDAIKPTQLYPTLESKLVEGLYSAGQINGTSGYEEAAAQGLIASVNAVNKIKGLSPLILGRDQAYIGVMIDDLVTKGTVDPYRLLTSRAEYRLLLRHDNADLRLRHYAYEYGLVSQVEYDYLLDKERQLAQGQQILDTIKITPKKEIISYLEQNEKALLHDGVSAAVIYKRPEITWTILMDLIVLMGDYSEELDRLRSLTHEVQEQLAIQIKYEGYIKKAKQQVQAAKKLEHKKIPAQIQYDVVPNLALEAQEKLTQIRPLTIGQASRIAGVNAVDIMMLDIYVSKVTKLNP